MHIELDVLPKSEILAGIRFTIVRFLRDSSDVDSFNENSENFPKGYVIELGLIFFKITLTIH